MKKRGFAVLLVLIMLLTITAGCTKPAAGDEPYTVTMMFIGNPQDDEEKVEEAINAITVPELNLKIDIMVLPFASAAEQIRLMLSGGEKLDLMLMMLMFGDSASGYVSSQSVYDLNDLIDQYGTNIKAKLGETAKVANMNGYVYGIPTSCDWYRQTSVLMRKDWLEEAGFVKEDIKSVEDLEKVYEAVAEKHPEAHMLGMMSAMSSYDANWYTSDSLSDGYGVLMNYGEKAEVENWFASEEYKAFVERQYRWAQNGWISKDAATSMDSPDAQIKAGICFSEVSTKHPSIEMEASLSIGIDMVVVPLYEAYKTTSTTTTFEWAVARNSEEPEKAFQMLDFIYGSEEVANLLNWGIEGEHYVMTEDGHATFPDGIDKTSAKYNAQFAFMLPNQFITHVWEGLPLDVHQTNEKNIENARASIAYGFAYDGTSLANELAALNNVCNQYLSALSTGSVNPADVLPKFLADLEAAGIQKVIDEKQRQLDAWMAQ